MLITSLMHPAHKAYDRSDAPGITPKYAYEDYYRSDALGITPKYASDLPYHEA